MKEIFKFINNYFKNGYGFFNKLIIIPAAILIIIYSYCTGIIQLILYPIFWLITKILNDNELNSDIEYRIRKVYSLSYWKF